MNYEKSFITMSDGKEIMFHSWTGEESPKAIVVISHGMAEHVSRYNDFAAMLVSRGFAVFGEDHRGHGESAVGRYGYLADKNGFFRVVDDIHEEILNLRQTYPETKIFLFGHSFGSFISQCYIEKYASSIDGCILCGTAGPRKGLIAAASVLAGIVSALGGKNPVNLKHIANRMIDHDKSTNGNCHCRRRNGRRRTGAGAGTARIFGNGDRARRTCTVCR